MSKQKFDDVARGSYSLWTWQSAHLSKFGMVQKDEVAQFQARCNELRHLLEPTQVSRDEGYRSQELESMQMG